MSVRVGFGGLRGVQDSGCTTLTAWGVGVQGFQVSGAEARVLGLGDLEFVP